MNCSVGSVGQLHPEESGQWLSVLMWTLVIMLPLRDPAWDQSYLVLLPEMGTVGSTAPSTCKFAGYIMLRWFDTHEDRMPSSGTWTSLRSGPWEHHEV